MKYIILAIVIYFIYKIAKGFSKSLNEPLDTNTVKHLCHYYGGFDDISAKEYNYVDLYVKDDCLYFSFTNKGNEVKSKKINYEDIIKVKFMNEKTISQEVSLGKMICFGWLSLAMRNEKVKIKEYLVIDSKYKNEEISIVIDDAYFHTNESLMTIINKELEKHR